MLLIMRGILLSNYLNYAIQSFMNQMLIMSISRSVQEALNYPK